MEHYLEAQQLRPDFPPYLANLGRYWLRVGQPEKIVALVEGLDPADKHKAVNEQVLAIYANCLEETGGESASKLRIEQIRKRTKTPVFYTDEAWYLLNRFRAEGDRDLLINALDILELARKNGAASDFTIAIQGSILEAMGLFADASKLRMEQIRKDTNNVSYAE